MKNIIDFLYDSLQFHPQKIRIKGMAETPIGSSPLVPPDAFRASLTDQPRH